MQAPAADSDTSTRANTSTAPGTSGSCTGCSGCTDMLPIGAMTGEPAAFQRMPNSVWTAVAGAAGSGCTASPAQRQCRTAKFMSISSMTPSSLGGVSMMASMLRRSSP